MDDTRSMEMSTLDTNAEHQSCCSMPERCELNDLRTRPYSLTGDREHGSTESVQCGQQHILSRKLEILREEDATQKDTVKKPNTEQ